jgi:hypothetical protein
MKAVIHTGVIVPWAADLTRSWVLLPVANRPILEYWLEWCAELNISSIRLVLDNGAQEVEAFAGEGERWGMNISYSFHQSRNSPASFLQRSPDEWISGGLLHVPQPCFPRRQPGLASAPPQSGRTYIHDQDNHLNCFLSRDPETVDDYIHCKLEFTGLASFRETGKHIMPLESILDFFSLNMDMVQGEMELYLRPGYFYKDQASIGYNVITPATATLTPPLIIGNDCRLGPITSIGPDAVIGNHVMVDRQCEISRALIFNGTFIGRGMEIRDKIVSGNMVMDPHSGAVVAVPDPWMVGPTQTLPGFRDIFQSIQSRLAAGIIVLTQLIPFALLFGWKLIRGSRIDHTRVKGKKQKILYLPVFTADEPSAGLSGRLFLALGLDRYPHFLQAMLGRLWLCGHRPGPVQPDTEQEMNAPDQGAFPAAITYADLRGQNNDADLERVEDLYYRYHRSSWEDLRILGRFIVKRWTDFFRGRTWC